MEDLSRLRDALARRQERLFDVAVYLRLRAPTRAALGTAREGLQARVQTAVARLGGDTRVLAYQQPQGFRAVLPEAGRRRAAPPWPWTPAASPAPLPFVVGDAGGSGVLVGLDRRAGPPVLFDLFDPGAANASLAVVAPAGSGQELPAQAAAPAPPAAGRGGPGARPRGGVPAPVRRRGRAARALRRLPREPPQPVRPAPGGGGRPDRRAERPGGGAGGGPRAGCSSCCWSAPTGAVSPEERAALDRAILEAYRREGHRAGDAGDARPGAPAAGRPARRAAAAPGTAGGGAPGRAARPLRHRPVPGPVRPADGRAPGPPLRPLRRAGPLRGRHGARRAAGGRDPPGHRPTSGAPCAGSAGPASSSPTRPPPCWSTRTAPASSATWPGAAGSTGWGCASRCSASTTCAPARPAWTCWPTPAPSSSWGTAPRTWARWWSAFELSDADRTDLVTAPAGARACSSPAPGGPSWRCWPAPRSTGCTPPAPTRWPQIEAEERAARAPAEARAARNGHAPVALALGGEGGDGGAG